MTTPAIQALLLLDNESFRSMTPSTTVGIAVDGVVELVVEVADVLNEELLIGVATSRYRRSAVWYWFAQRILRSKPASGLEMAEYMVCVLHAGKSDALLCL